MLALRFCVLFSCHLLVSRQPSHPVTSHRKTSLDLGAQPIGLRKGSREQGRGKSIELKWDLLYTSCRPNTYANLRN